ncbi:OmpA family protein [Thalassotalea euphylliae]|uniref:OmpA family protein n=1 Tax=Thalassotalea euphylliae TaxID=1655234 RepID=A0A3E0TUH5_9GAMM|nr:OmpA family protein [Thalassotalea euphylliae]REL28017.1 OmpA family protein [Thalassotalea euphylliae]
MKALLQLLPVSELTVAKPRLTPLKLAKHKLLKPRVLLAAIMLNTALLLASCSVANRAQTTLASTAAQPAALNSNQQVVHEYLQATRLKVLSLTTRLSHQCLAGQLDVSYRLLNQTEQEVAGQMYADAFITLTHLDRQVRKLECIQGYIEGHFGCHQTENITVLRDWYKEGPFDQCDRNPAFADTRLNRLTAANQFEAANQSETESVEPSRHTIITETLHDFDQAGIKPIYFPALDKLVALMLSFPDSTLVISGHADSLGSEKYNLGLSQQRAQQVADYFTAAGVASSKIQIKALGETAPRQVATSPVQRVFNRYTQVSLSLVLPSTAKTSSLSLASSK